jgi:MFS family permease
MSASTETKKVNYFDLVGVMALVATTLVIALSGSAIGSVNAMVPRFMITMDIRATEIAYAAMLVAGIGALFSFVGTKVIDKLTPRVCLVIGAILEGLYMILTGVTTSYPIFVLAGVLGGIGMGLGTIPAAVGIANQYFGEFSGRVAGIFIFGMMIGASLMSFFEAFLLETLPYGTILVILGIVTAVGCTLLCLICIRKPSPEVQARIEELKILKAADEEKKAKSVTGLTSNEAIKTPAFWLMAFGMFFGAVILAYFATYSAVFFTEPPNNMPLIEATRWRGLMQLFCAINVLWVGFFVAKFGPKKYVWLIYGAIVVGAILFLVWVPLQFVFILVVALFLSGFDQCTTTAPANILPPIFGRKDYTGINSAMMGFYYAGIVFSQITSARILDVFGGTYSLVWIAFCSVVSMILFLLALRTSPVKKLIEQGLVRAEDVK